MQFNIDQVARRLLLACALFAGMTGLSRPAMAEVPMATAAAAATASASAVAEPRAADTRLEIVAPSPRVFLSQTLFPAAASLATLVAAHVMPAALDAETECLAGAVYFESRGEPLEGQLAVAEVIRNRAASGRFPSSLCGVVFQPSQFSFVRGGAMPPIRRESDQWRRAVAVAQIALGGGWISSVGKALFFHASRISPGWRLKRLARVGNHIFYR